MMAGYDKPEECCEACMREREQLTVEVERLRGRMARARTLLAGYAGIGIARARIELGEQTISLATTTPEDPDDD